MILVRYGEIHLKGQNRPYFERLLRRNMERALFGIPDVRVQKGEGRFYVTGVSRQHQPQAMEALRRVFGVHSVSLAVESEKNMEAICAVAAGLLGEHMLRNGMVQATFKVESKRADKLFPLNSMQISSQAGAYLLQKIKNISVDVHRPQVRVYVEVREQAFCYLDILPGAGGLPVGSGGTAMLLLSGGIDSPVAGYMTAKRGVSLQAIHFMSPPYTSEAARQKVVQLAKLLTGFAGPIRLHFVPFTEIQTQIYKNCPHEELVTIMRRFMIRIAERTAQSEGAAALVTGESIGQVASQTLDSMSVTGAAAQMLILRPLLGLDKQEIMERAVKIGTYETSILPYEDCCTVFVPKHPVTHPKIERIERSEQKLPVDEIIKRAAEGIETIDL